MKGPAGGGEERSPWSLEGGLEGPSERGAQPEDGRDLDLASGPPGGGCNDLTHLEVAALAQAAQAEEAGY